MKKTFLITLLLFLISFIFIPTISNAENASLRVSPGILEIEEPIKIGDEVKLQKFKVTNSSEKETEITVTSSKDIILKGETEFKLKSGQSREVEAILKPTNSEKEENVAKVYFTGDNGGNNLAELVPAVKYKAEVKTVGDYVIYVVLGLILIIVILLLVNRRRRFKKETNIDINEIEVNYDGNSETREKDSTMNKKEQKDKKDLD